MSGTTGRVVRGIVAGCVALAIGAGGVVGLAAAPAAAAAPALEQQPEQQTPVRVGGMVKEPVRIKFVEPKYPPEAVRDKIEGTVFIEAIIDVEGKVRALKVLRGIPELDAAAVAAVAQWAYTPTLLNDQPVEVIMTVNVRFQLK
jgi:protein TonB